MSERLVVIGRDSQGNTVTKTIDIPVRDPGIPVFTHGEQLRPDLIGARGSSFTEQPWTSTIRDGQLFRNIRFTSPVNTTHHTDFDNCQLLGTPTGSYVLRHVAGTGKKVRLLNSTVVQRNPATKAITMYGAGGLYVYRSLVKGGTDGLFLKPKGGPYFEGFAAVVRESMIGWLQQVSGGHSDGIQIDGDGGGVTGGALFDRIRVEAFYVPSGADPLTANWDPTRLAGTAMIMTGTSPITNIRIRDSKFSGGNYTTQLEGATGSGPIELTGNRYGVAHRYGPIRIRSDATVAGNTWAETGTTACCGQVTRGQPL